MSKYTGTKCPVCGEVFTESCDIVVCPDCGLPHHRACWKKLGHCAKPELHFSAADVSDPAPETIPETDTANAVPPPETVPKADAANAAPPPEAPGDASAPQSKLCPVCHAENNADASFCHSCGIPLSRTDGAQPGPHFQVLFDPLGGVKPEEEIDGVPAGDLAQVVGENSAYYLPRFKAIAKSKKAFSMNLTALLFDLPWLFSRKMYIHAIGLMILKLALAAPTVWGIWETQKAGVVLNFSDSFWFIYNVCSVLQVVLQVAISLFANRLYKNHCVALAQKLRAHCPDDESFRTAARKKGGISKFFLYTTGALTVLYYILTLFINFVQ